MVHLIRFQLWPLDKKLRVVNQAKEYVKKHNSEMEERLAQSRTFGSRVQQLRLYIMKCLAVRLDISNLIIT